MMMKILKLLVLCDDRVYSKAIARSIMLLLHQRKICADSAWAYLYENNLNLVNEEIGEISISILQRSLLKSPFKRDVKSVSSKYADVSSIVNSLGTDISDVLTRFAANRSHRRTLTNSSFEFEKVKLYLTEEIERIRDGNPRIYGSVAGFRSAVDGAISIDNSSRVTPIFRDSELKLKGLMKSEVKCWQTYMNSTEHRRDWPQSSSTSRGDGLRSDDDAQGIVQGFSLPSINSLGNVAEDLFGVSERHANSDSEAESTESGFYCAIN